MEDNAHRVTLGRICGVFGIKGAVKVLSHCRPPEAIFDYAPWQLEGSAGEFSIIESRVQNNGLVVHLATPNGAAVADRDIAASMVGKQIFALRSQLKKLKPNEVYWVDLVGMQVQSATGAPLGTVADVVSNGAQDVLVVHEVKAAADAAVEAETVERLIPFVRGATIESVCLDKKLVIAHWEPEW